MDLTARAVTAIPAVSSRGNGGGGDDGGDDGDTAWDIIGPADVWDQMLAGRLNVNVAMRRCLVRYLGTGEAPDAVHDLRVGMFAGLIGLTSW